MSKHIFLVMLAACLAAGALRAENDPFVGKWKLNPSKSKLSDVMKVESIGGKKYAFDFGSGNAETIVADGTDQPGNGGTTLAVTMVDSNTWKVVRKKNGRTMLTATWELAKDGSTLTDHFTGNRPDGSTSKVDYVFKRAAPGTGFVAEWESVSEQMNSTFEIQIQPYEGDGLSFISQAEGSTKNIKFDGKDYPVAGSELPVGFVASGRRMNGRTLELTDKIGGKVTNTRQVELSPDLKTLTMTVRRMSGGKPSVLVFERE
jgi:hypothetical protein